MGYDPIRTLRTLCDRAVEFVVIGGVAGRLWGSPTLTNDTDVCCSASPANLDRLAGALVEVGARLRGVDDGLQIEIDGRLLATAETWTFATDAGALDVLTGPAGTRGFAELRANAARFDLGEGLVVVVCSLEDLMRMKRAAGRPKDRIELEVLAAVRDELADGSD